LKLIHLLLAVLLGNCCVVRAQEVHRQTLYWIRYQNQFSLSPTRYLNTEVDNRRFINPDIQNQFILHVRYHYKTRGWDFGGGLTGSLAYASIPQNGAVKNPVVELRPVIEGSYDWNSGRNAVQNRLRLDHRFIEDATENSILRSSDYIPRLRHRLQWKHVFRKRHNGVPLLGCRVSNEIMVNLRKGFFDQNRLYGSCDFPISKTLSMEIGYIYIYQQRLGIDSQYFSRNVLRFSLLHKL
jgi:hypothetical protein